MAEYSEHVNQVIKLLETGRCDLPVDWQNLADKVSRHPIFPHALAALYRQKSGQMLRLITEVCAIQLCKDFSDEDNNIGNLPDTGVNSIE